MIGRGGGRLGALALLLLGGCDLPGGAHPPSDPGIARAEASFECAGPLDTSALVHHPSPIDGAGAVYFDIPRGFTVYGFPVRELSANGAVLWAKLPREEFTVLAAIRERLPNGQLRQHPANASDPLDFDLLPGPGYAYGSPGMATRPLMIESEGPDAAVRCGDGGAMLEDGGFVAPRPGSAGPSSGSTGG